VHIRKLPRNHSSKMKLFSGAVFAVILLLPLSCAAFSPPSDVSDLSSDVDLNHLESTGDVHLRLKHHWDAILEIIRGADHPLREEIKPMVLQRAATVTRHFEEPRESKPPTEMQGPDDPKFIELHEGSSSSAAVGRRGGQLAAGGFAWVAASGNRAGNSEDDEELGQASDSWSQAEKEELEYDKAGCRIRRNGTKVCKAKYGECQEHCWKYAPDWICPGCWNQVPDAKKVADAITAAWESNRGLAYCEKHMTKPVLTKSMSASSASVEEMKKQIGEENSDLLDKIDVSNVTAGFRWNDHFVVHRSGVHSVNGGHLLLCASWTAVCLRTTTSNGQSCATVRQVLGCKKKEMRKFIDCRTWGSANQVALPDFA